MIISRKTDYPYTQYQKFSCLEVHNVRIPLKRLFPAFWIRGENRAPHPIRSVDTEDLDIFMA
jgi:hypothetical protein